VGANMAIQQQITQRSWTPAHFDDETTRLLCASARLDPAFAGDVLASLVGQPHQAIAPSSGVDLVALARHAARSRRAYFRRNLAHSMLLLVGLIALGVALLSSQSVVPSLLVVGATALLAWIVQLTDLWIARREALELVEIDEDPASLAPPIDPHLERRLPKLDELNVVVYGANRQYPFVGSGWSVGGWAIPPVDVTKAAPDERGGKRKIIPFDAVDLHKHLLDTILKRGPAGVQVSNRLYVRGPAAPYVRGVLGGRLGIPQPKVDSAVHDSVLRDPQSTLQTYLCLEKITFGGQLAVSMFVHAVLDKNLLTVMADAFFLPPLRWSFWNVLRLSRRRWLIVARTMADAVVAVPHDLLAAPVEFVRYWLRKVKRRYRLARDTWRIRHRRGFDYGAVSSIREDAADLTEAKHVHLANWQRYFRMLQHQVIDAVLEFLDGHNVDISDLRKRQVDIVNATSYTFQGPVYGQGHIFGSYGQQTNFPPALPPAHGGNPAGSKPG
jgi:hypothetical protein